MTQFKWHHPNKPGFDQPGNTRRFPLPLQYELTSGNGKEVEPSIVFFIHARQAKLRIELSPSASL